MSERFELISIYDSKEGFYNKANIEISKKDNKEIRKLFSYNTKVAEITYEPNKGRTFKIMKLSNKKLYSNTTMRHVREFMRQNGLSEEAENSKKELLEEFVV